MRLKLEQCFLTDARRYVAERHRHNMPPLGGIFAVAASLDGNRVGVAIVGRPISRELQAREPFTCEITRLCTDGTFNACSFLYGASVRAAKALGWHAVITYTLASESGASLRAAGFTVDAEVKAERSWSRPSRPRVQTDLFGEDTRPAEDKIRWRRALVTKPTLLRVASGKD